MTTPTELGDIVADYAHRTDLLSRINDRFIPYAALRIGRDLRSVEQETELEVDPVDNPSALPADWSSPRLIEFLESRGPVTLKSATWHWINRIDSRTGLGGSPRWYAIRNQSIDFRPFKTGTYRLTYYAKPTLIAGDDNELIDAHTTIWINATLIEVHTWTQDSEQRQIALDMYQGEIVVANRQAEWARVEAPAVKGV